MEADPYWELAQGRYEDGDILDQEYDQWVFETWCVDNDLHPDSTEARLKWERRNETR